MTWWRVDTKRGGGTTVTPNPGSDFDGVYFVEASTPEAARRKAEAKIDEMQLLVDALREGSIDTSQLRAAKLLVYREVSKAWGLSTNNGSFTNWLRERVKELEKS